MLVQFYSPSFEKELVSVLEDIEDRYKNKHSPYTSANPESTYTPAISLENVPVSDHSLPNVCILIFMYLIIFIFKCNYFC